MLTNRTARKQWRCDAGFLCEKAPQNVIDPGERYTDEVFPPWMLTSDDPESPPFPLGEWVHHRYHVGCYYPY